MFLSDVSVLQKNISIERLEISVSCFYRTNYPTRLGGRHSGLPAMPVTTEGIFQVMKNFKSYLLAATVAAGAFGSSAQAQILLPSVELRGVGASSVSTVIPQSLNCIGTINPLGKNDGTISSIAASSYNPPSPALTNPVFDCASGAVESDVPVYTRTVVQPDFTGLYISTGSGFGRQEWRLFSNQFDGTSGKIFPTSAPFNGTPWPNVQFAFSEAPATASDITAYNTNAAPTAKAAIQFPFYVVPMALAYNPKYGTSPTAAELTFNVKSTYVTKDVAGNPTGGLRLNKSAYCKIINGEITNWNDAALKTLNGAQSLMDADDSLARWNAEGVTIRLVGRLDKSGGTDIFTRHIAEACDSFVTTNKFANAAEALPFDNTSGIDLTSFRSDTPYKPGGSGYAGTIQSLSGAVFVSTASGINTTQGAEAAGKFMVADGSGKVRDAINYGPDRNSTHTAGFVLNGKLGYIGADFVKPTPGATLFSAALQKGTTTAYVAPTAANGSAAVGTILPPQSIATSGAYNITDTRTNSVTGLPVDRANPLDWVDVLYSDPAKTLANPIAGYPMTGVSMMLTYTCFSTVPKRLALVEFVSLNFGKVTKTYQNKAISANTFKGSAPTSLGIVPKSGIAAMPAGWQNAINETFLKKSVQDGDPTATIAKLGDRNLWIQDKLPTQLIQIDGIGTNDIKSNPTCTAGTGA